jgi:hypothetical protein
VCRHGVGPGWHCALHKYSIATLAPFCPFVPQIHPRYEGLTAEQKSETAVLAWPDPFGNPGNVPRSIVGASGYYYNGVAVWCVACTTHADATRDSTVHVSRIYPHSYARAEGLVYPNGLYSLTTGTVASRDGLLNSRSGVCGAAPPCDISSVLPVIAHGVLSLQHPGSIALIKARRLTQCPHSDFVDGRPDGGNGRGQLVCSIRHAQHPIRTALYISPWPRH